MRHFLSFIFIVLASWATAQSYPEPSDLAVNDFAGILSDEAEARLVEKLDKLRGDTGVEMVVLTLSRQDTFAPDISLKKFARGIFDEWGIGHKKRDDGVLVLVMRGDQKIRIALGEGLGKKADKAADKAVERSFLPDFREDRYEQGIEKGVDDLIENLVGPYVIKRNEDTGDGEAVASAESATSAETVTSAETTADPKEGGSLSWLLWVAGGIAALIAFLKLKAGMRKCPECGAKGLKIASNTVTPATEDSVGQGEKITSCDKCGHRDVEIYEIAKRSKPDKKKEEFGGGKAGKDGATGKW